MLRRSRLSLLTPSFLAGLLGSLALLIALTLHGAAHAQAFLSSAATGTGAVVQTGQARTELVAHAPQGIAPGQTFWAGLRITHAKDWHTYWKNPGDSGLPTELRWTLPPGIQAGDIAWPAPKKFAIGTSDPLINYGYEDTVLLPVALTVSKDFQVAPGQNDLTLQLQASWLICRSECIPEEGRYTLRIPLRGATSLDAQAFEAARRAHPRDVAVGESHIQIEGDHLKLTVADLPQRLRGQKLDAFPETVDVLNPSAPWTQAWQGPLWTATLPLSAQRSASPLVLPVVLTVAQGSGSVSGSGHRNASEGWRVELPVRGAWPAAAAPVTLSPALQEALDAKAASTRSATHVTSLTFGAALALALLGGLILNLMPCVLPILAIKVLGFAQHAQDPRTLRLSGLAYTAGVLLSFLALGLALLGLRSAGESLGWGFQLQSPAMVAALAVLFTVIALNLAGLFEFGQMAPGRLATLQARHPMLDAALTGVLAVIVASPCTAPFMGAALGLAATLPAAQALAIFGALGLGLALPYLAATFIPAVARLLPRPGAWMLTLRRVLAFPMLLTVVWLVWVLGHQSGVDGAATLLVLLVLLAALVWVLTLKGRARIVLGLVLLAVGGWFGATFGASMFTDAASVAESQTRDDAGWQTWSPAREQALLAHGRAVFVDYTAAWCVTCQVNKRTTLNDAQVLKAFAARDVVLLRADWTRRDPAIGAALAALGRSGVPVYVLHRPARPEPRTPLVLSELLSPGEVQRALDTL